MKPGFYSFSMIWGGLLIFGLATAFAFTGCGEVETEGDYEEELTEEKALSDEDYMAKGREIAGLISSALMSEVMRAMEERGPAAAVDFCSVRAIPITDSISKAEGVKIERVSHKPRNPDNAANEREMDIIRGYQDAAEDETARPQLVSVNDQKTFYAPIKIVAETCMTCHGDVGTDVDPELYNTILANYPDDMATGFKLGDLRGLMKITFVDRDYQNL